MTDMDFTSGDIYAGGDFDGARPVTAADVDAAYAAVDAVKARRDAAHTDAEYNRINKQVEEAAWQASCVRRVWEKAVRFDAERAQESYNRMIDTYGAGHPVTKAAYAEMVTCVQRAIDASGVYAVSF